MGEAILCREKNENKTILFALDANNNLDLETFKHFLDGALENQPLLEKEIQEALDKLPNLPDH